MALRIICRSLAAKCNVTALQLPRAAASLGCQTSSSTLRHAGCLAATRDTCAFTSLRQLNTSVTARSALTDILQEELNYESENYTPTEVRNLYKMFVYQFRVSSPWCFHDTTDNT